VPQDKTERAELAIAYAHCEQVTKHHSKSFYLATSFLPREKRRAIRAFYAFCRTTDDIVDLPRTAFLNLEEWRHAARKAPSAQTNPVLLAWAHTRDRYNVPQQYAEELIDGCELDLRVSRYQNFEQLRRYCYLVASTVGLISMHIIGSTDDKGFDGPTTDSAIELGIALQMTNILRDVGEDLTRGRIYLPQEEMADFGYPERDLCEQKNTAQFQGLMQFQIDRTDALYRDNLYGIAKLKQDGRMAVGSAILLYRGILNKIEQNRYNVFTKRAHLSTAEKLTRLPSIYAQIRSMKYEV
jgi:phytoene synthase